MCLFTGICFIRRSHGNPALFRFLPEKTFLPVNSFVTTKSGGRQQVQEHRKEPSVHLEMRTPNLANITGRHAEFKHRTYSRSLFSSLFVCFTQKKTPNPDVPLQFC